MKEINIELSEESAKEIVDLELKLGIIGIGQDIIKELYNKRVKAKMQPMKAWLG